MTRIVKITDNFDVVREWKEKNVWNNDESGDGRQKQDLTTKVKNA